MLTRQQLFDAGVTGVIGQGQPSISPRPGNLDAGAPVCEYRQGRVADAPVRCALGWAIPDDLYDQNMDYGGLVLEDILRAIEYEDLSDDFPTDFQEAHDYADRNNFVDNFAYAARRVAEKYRLDTSAINAALVKRQPAHA